MISGRTDIAQFIPQRPPFVFIDTVEEVTETTARTRFTVPAECPLVTDGILPLSGLMENAAQTCAVRAGNTIGYIGAVKAMQVTRFPEVGQTIQTEATVVQEVLNICLMEVKTYLEDQLIASTTLKIAVIDN